jgi:hypothetical protein
MAGPSKPNQRTSPSSNEQDESKSNQEEPKLRRNSRREAAGAKKDATDARRASRSTSADAAKSKDKGGVTYELQSSPGKEPPKSSKVTFLRLAPIHWLCGRPCVSPAVRRLYCLCIMYISTSSFDLKTRVYEIIGRS